MQNENFGPSSLAECSLDGISDICDKNFQLLGHLTDCEQIFKITYIHRVETISGTCD